MIRGRKPTDNEMLHMKQVRALGCIVCRNLNKGFVPSEIHHIRGKTKHNAHYDVLPLCYAHHRGISSTEPISRHPFKYRFEKTYGKEEDLLKQVNKLLDKYTEDDLPF